MSPDDPRHGTPAQPAYELVPHCDCTRCEAARTWRRRTAKQRRRGTYRLTDATPARAHIDTLIAQGWRAADIARAAGISPPSLSELRNGSRDKVFVHTAAAILACGEGHALTVPALGTIRRVRALAAIGWPMRDVCERAGLNRTYAAELMASGRERCDANAANAIADVYERLHMTPGPSKSARTRAANRRWPPPLAFDNPDDPAETPRAIRDRVRRDYKKDAA